MRWIVSSRAALAAAAFAMFVLGPATPAARAQGVTTGAIAGAATDSAGAPLEGVRIVAVHGPSGTTYAASTRADGRFTLPGMRVGGPYRVTASRVGYRPTVHNDVNVGLGTTSDLRFRLAPASVELEAITVEATADNIFSSERTGAATTITKEQLQKLPTISRRVEDLLRLTPQYSPMSFGFSFAGQDNRLNNTTIDGSYFNNSFGLAGQPGDRTGVTPVSMDALQQVQVAIAPYDVRQGNFVGAGVNMVTKSGANAFSGSVFYNMRNNDYVGTQAGPNKFNPGTFDYTNIGISLGGPIIRNKLFFFANYEDDKQTQPGTTFTARNSLTDSVQGTTTRVLASDLDSLSSFLRNNFDYETGPYQGYDFRIPSTRFLARLDFNLNENHKFSIRYNLLNSVSDQLVSNSTSLGRGNRRTSLQSLNFANSNYAILENIRSIVGEWNATFGNKSNNLIVGYNKSDESRKNVNGPWFPEVEIFQGTSNYTTFGFEPFTPHNKLFYNSYQLQDNFTLYLPQHSVTMGLSVEKYHSTNVFNSGAQSIYVYNSLADWYTDANDYLANPTRTVSPVTLNRFQVRYANLSGQTEPVQPLDVLYSGVYVQDEWRPNPNLTLTAGLRVDAPNFENTAYANSVADTMTFRDQNGNPVQYSSGSLPGVNLLFSPRFGFNLNVGGQQKTQIRGGTGVFTGRPAYVWISNQIGNTGMLTGFISQDNTTAFPFHPDPEHYKPAPSDAPASSFQLALTDPNFQFPQLWRTNMAVDQRLPWGLTGTAEYMYSKDVNGIAYINANLPAPQSAFFGPDGRPRWTANRIYSTVSDATVLTNQGKGSSWNIAATLEGSWRSGLFAKVGYSYGVSKNTVDAGSIAQGSWAGNAIALDPNNPIAAYSQFNPGPRVFTAVTYTRDFFKIGPTSIGMYWDGRSSGSDSYIFSNDMNGDGATNDLIYIPRNTSEMNFQQYTQAGTTYTVAQQVAAWEAYIQQDAYLRAHRGEYAGRNAVRRPMVYRADLSISQDISRRIGSAPHSLQVRLDMLNFTNWLNDDWGVSTILVTNRPLASQGVDATGANLYRLNTVSQGGALISKSIQKAVTTSDVWRMQLGVRYMFNW
ncbi:MAG TPA: carboxypeptidase regulatory-like domain-containing protein [Gemmatimonadales bacterium]|nr:carboxypeptidase regulatory-like domain-containing protein [Gemmatimonadales bacterium]